MFDIIALKFILRGLVLHFISRDIKDMGKAVKYLLFRAGFILILIKEISLVLITASHCCRSRMGIVLFFWVY